MRQSRLSRDKTRKNDESSDVELNRRTNQDEMKNTNRPSKPPEKYSFEKELEAKLFSNRDTKKDPPEVTLDLILGSGKKNRFSYTPEPRSETSTHKTERGYFRYAAIKADFRCKAKS